MGRRTADRLLRPARAGVPGSRSSRRAFREDIATPGDVLTRMLHAIDELDWDTMRDCFTAKVDTDYTSLWGGEPATVFVGDLIADWQGFAHGLAATQHQ